MEVNKMAKRKNCCANGVCPSCDCCICICTKRLKPEARKLLKEALA